MISVLVYHQIDNMPIESDPFRYTVTPETFEEQMKFLYDNNYKVINLDNAMEVWQSKRTEPQKHVVITFDDGYHDLLTTVQPVLEKYGFTATVFLVANQVGKKSQWEGQISIPLLSWDEIRTLQDSGFIFGSHTLNHPFLTTLTDEQAEKEIKESKVIIEQNIGKRVDFFAYPFFDMDARIERIVSEAGYLGACGGGKLDWNPYNIWRATCTGNDDMLTYRFNTLGWYRYAAQLRKNDLLRPLGRGLKGVIKKLLNR